MENISEKSTLSVPNSIYHVTLDGLPGHIKHCYQRFALVSQRNQVDKLNPADKETLIVSCDWLLWQCLLAEGRHAVYFELGLLGWHEQEKLNSGLFLHANDWIFDGNDDLTTFHGASLGMLFCGEIFMCLMNFYRLDEALRSLITQFKPKEVKFFDYANEINVLERRVRSQIVEAVCRDFGVLFEDCASDTAGDSSIADKIFTGPKDSLLKRIILAVYTRGLEAASNLRCLFKDGDKRVFIMVNSNLLEPLAETFPGGVLNPLFLGRTLPKKPLLLWRCLKRGVLLVTPREPELSAEDCRRLEEIRTDVKAVLRQPRDDVPDIVASHILKEIFETNRLTEAARKVLMAERFFERYGPRRIVVDGVRNALPYAYIEMARLFSAEVDYIWHGPLTPLSNKFAALGSDPRVKPLVTRCLSWGDVSDAWLDAVGAQPPRVRVGCPLSERYIRRDKPTPTKKKNVLVLQYTPQVQDLRGLNANAFVHFVTVVRKLCELGFENIVMKLHPGPGRWKKDYFEAVAAYFNLDCPVYKTKPFSECLEWADMVIGPLPTGAMFETLAAGKPYLAFLMPPHSMDTRYYGNYPILTSAEELENHIERDYGQEPQALLNAIYCMDQFPSGSKRFWEVLKNDLE